MSQDMDMKRVNAAVKITVRMDRLRLDLARLLQGMNAQEYAEFRKRVK